MPILFVVVTVETSRSPVSAATADMPKRRLIINVFINVKVPNLKQCIRRARMEQRPNAPKIFSGMADTLPLN
jgi:hypothetical protein